MANDAKQLGYQLRRGWDGWPSLRLSEIAKDLRRRKGAGPRDRKIGPNEEIREELRPVQPCHRQCFQTLRDWLVDVHTECKPLLTL